jgi:outer membrane protein assembly factor BamE
MHALLPFLLVALLSGCSSWGFPGVYRIDVEQGNIVTQEMVDQLAPGMTRRQVRYILGTPLLEDSFNRDRWDYVYSVRNGNTLKQEDRLSIFFDGEELSHFTSTIPASVIEQVEETETAVQAYDDGEASESAAETE